MITKSYSLLHKTPKHPGLSFVGKTSRTLQSHKKETDINHIMKKFRETGVLPVPQNRQPFFGDFSDTPDYLAAQNALVNLRTSFAMLPAATRERFSNDPGKVLEFLSDKENEAEAIKLGLVKKPALKPAEKPAEKPVPKAAEKSAAKKKAADEDAD